MVIIEKWEQTEIKEIYSRPTLALSFYRVITNIQTSFEIQPCKKLKSSICIKLAASIKTHLQWYTKIVFFLALIYTRYIYIYSSKTVKHNCSTTHITHLKEMFMTIRFFMMLSNYQLLLAWSICSTCNTYLRVFTFLLLS